MNDLLDRLGVAVPVVQAGMGGGMSGPGLAAAVSEAGGLGTIGLGSPAVLREQVETARGLTTRPIAVNLLLPFARPAHWEAAGRADVVVTFWGAPRRGGSTTWLHQCGSVAEALAARAAGADAVIVQGVEAGGHVRGTTPALDLLHRARAALPPDYPVLLAGGIATAADVEAALDAGATAAVAGTRFLMSEESSASPTYKERLVGADDTVLTELFGVGWAAPHRVLRNAATDRWLRRDPRGPHAVRLLQRVTAPAVARLPERAQAAVTARQVVGIPFFSPIPPSAGSPERLVEVSPLYAGETVARIHDIRPAAAILRSLTPS